MPGQREQENRKQILKDLKQKAKEEFEKTLPLSRDLFEKLFNYLDDELQHEDCDDTFKLTERFLATENITDLSAITKWLGDHGACCDCEVLANIEEQFET